MLIPTPLVPKNSPRGTYSCMKATALSTWAK